MRNNDRVPDVNSVMPNSGFDANDKSTAEYFFNWQVLQESLINQLGTASYIFGIFIGIADNMAAARYTNDTACKSKSHDSGMQQHKTSLPVILFGLCLSAIYLAIATPIVLCYWIAAEGLLNSTFKVGSAVVNTMLNFLGYGVTEIKSPSNNTSKLSNNEEVKSLDTKNTAIEPLFSEVVEHIASPLSTPKKPDAKPLIWVRTSSDFTPSDSSQSTHSPNSSSSDEEKEEKEEKIETKTHKSKKHRNSIFKIYS